jgi:FkbM family methyltransferase
MNVLERVSLAVRHAPALERADWLWDRVRPLYDRLLRASFSARGLERIINGTDRIVLSPRARGFVAQSYEPAVWRRVMREVRSGEVVAEVGASIGVYTLAFAARVGSGGRVFAFEPDPESAATLEANLAVNHWQDRVTVVRAAVGAVEGTAAFASGRGMESHVAEGDVRGGAMASHLAERDVGGASIEVAMVTLDGVFSGRAVDFLKIDVEGYEEPVLRGAAALLGDRERRPRAILVELHPSAWNAVGTTSDSLLSFLGGHGYHVEDLAGSPVELVTDYGHIVALAS